MVDPTSRPIQATQTGSVHAPGASRPALDPAAAERAAKFQVLLEALDHRAREVAKSAQEPLAAEDLASAVENARHSLEGALRISQDLLEAVRQSDAQAAARKVQGP